jgi:hypothetical protein
MKSTSTITASGIHGQRFAPVPNWLLCRHEISDGAKLVFGRLRQYCGGEASCFPKQTTLAAELGKSERSIRDHLTELVEHRLIRRVQRGFARSNVYQATGDPLPTAPSPETPAVIPSRAAESCRSGTADFRRHDRRNLAVPVEEEITEKNTEVRSHTQAGVSFAFVSPSLEEARTAGDMGRIPIAAVEKWHAEMEAVGWINKHSQPLRNWRAALRAYGISWRVVDERSHQSASARSKRQRRPEATLIHENIKPKICP